MKLKLFLFAALIQASAFASTPSRVSLLELSATPVITAGAYTAGMQVGGVQALDIGIEKAGGATLFDVSIIDNDKQKAAIDILFFNQLPTFTSSDHATFALSNANAVNFIGGVSVAAANYRDASAQSFASVGNIWQKLKSINTGTKVYAVAVSRGTPTYTTTSSLKFVYHFEQN